MKNSVFFVLILAGSLALGLGTACLRSALTHPASAVPELDAAPDPIAPLDSYEIIEGCGAVFDTALSQWSFCDQLTLRSQPLSPVYALHGGTVKEVISSDDAPSLVIESDEGSCFYGGVIATLRAGALCQGGDVIGLMKGDILTLRCDEEGHFVDPAQFLP